MPLAFISGCYYLQPTTIPVAHKVVAAPEAGKRVMIMLPGIGDLGDAFLKNNFDQMLQQKFSDFEVVTVDAHFKYYNQRTLLTRLKEDIVQPYLDKGYSVYMTGISLGGAGSLLYFKEYPDDIEKFLLLAPYLGESVEYQYLIDGGERNEEEIEVDLWPWLISLEEKQREKIYMGYGLEDKFAIPNGLLADYLPEQHTITINGKHRWDVWVQLWPALIDRALMDDN